MNNHLETEIKVACTDLDEMLIRLQKAGFSLTTIQPRHFEDNWLLDTQPPTLRHQRAALRLRLAEGNAIVTYKGVPAEAVEKNLKIREELEVKVNDSQLMLLIFERLGYRPVFRYQKYRTTYRLNLTEPEIELLAMFDETPIGVFLELEGTTETVKFAIHRLNLSSEDICTETYISLQKARCEAAGLPLQDMVFLEMG